MNGARLADVERLSVPLIVPGYYGTYWVKHLSEIQVLDKVFDGFWMSAAYRIPDNACACVEPGTAPARTIPIHRFNVRSFITSLNDGDMVSVGRETVVRGIAFDGSYGIAQVVLSTDGGRTWAEARLGDDLGKYSFRESKTSFRPSKRGPQELKVRAVNRIGQSQPMNGLWNAPGYMRNVVETTRVTAA